MLAILYLHSRRFLVWALSALFVVLFFLGDIKPAPSQPAVETNLPTRILQTSGADSTNALLPEWSQISLGSLPPINSGGSVNAGSVSRSWKSGQTPDQFLSLGDISQALRSELLPVSEVGKKTNLDVKSIALSAFPLIGEQTLNQLVEAVSSLGQVKAANIPPVAALLATKGLTNSLNLSLSSILNQFPQVGNSKLKEIDLQQFPLSSIPNLDATPLQQFNGWQNAVV
ncbi:MAG: M23 family peptidase, partial [Crinalium sp.]